MSGIFLVRYFAWLSRSVVYGCLLLTIFGFFLFGEIAELTGSSKVLAASAPATSSATVMLAPSDVARAEDPFSGNFPGSVRGLSPALQMVLRLAISSGVLLQDGEYRVADDGLSGWSSYLISLPVKGDWSAIRSFLVTALLAEPALSISSIKLIRTRVVDEQLEANIVLVLHFRNAS